MAPSAGLPAVAVDWLACPVDGAAPLKVAVTEPASPGAVDGAAGIVHGTLACPACARVYPVEDGIPRLLPDPAALEAAEAEAKRSERQQRDREAGIYDRNFLLRLLTAAEAPATLRRLQAGAADRILEVGCGTGRFTTRLVGKTAALLALDHSVESLRQARSKLGGRPLCGPSPSVTGAKRSRCPRSGRGAMAIFAQADASYLPVRGGWATRVLSCQMLEHIPTPGARQRAVREMARALAPGGRLVLSAYYHPPVINRWLPKEGRHSGEIYFYRFARAELAELLAERLRLRGITGRLVYILLAHAER